MVVTSLRDNTFFAVIEMRNSEGNRMVLDSRPSDAIALALRADCPIYVDMEVIKASRNTLPTEEAEESEIDSRLKKNGPTSSAKPAICLCNVWPM